MTMMNSGQISVALAATARPKAIKIEPAIIIALQPRRSTPTPTRIAMTAYSSRPDEYAPVTSATVHPWSWTMAGYSTENAVRVPIKMNIDVNARLTVGQWSRASLGTRVAGRDESERADAERTRECSRNGQRRVASRISGNGAG